MHLLKESEHVFKSVRWKNINCNYCEFFFFFKVPSIFFWLHFTI